MKFGEFLAVAALSEKKQNSRNLSPSDAMLYLSLNVSWVAANEANRKVILFKEEPVYCTK